MTTPTKRVTPCPTPFTDHVYKTVAGVDVPLRLWPVEGKPKGWLLWFHGGAFISGKHVIPNAWVVPSFRERGYVVVSAAYRLAPHAGLADILHDCADAFAWCRQHLPSPSLAGLDAATLHAYVVGGDSAGGTLATLCGHVFSPPPRAVLDVFGVTDLADAHFRPPASAERETRDLCGEFTAEQVDAALAERDVARAGTIGAWDWEMEPAMNVPDLQTFWGLEYTPGKEDKLRMDMVKRVKFAPGGLFGILLRKERFAPEEEEEWRAELEKYSSLALLRGKQRYPPTAFVHGRGDTTVPVAHSIRMADKLRDMGVDVVERYHPTGEHCFENTIENPGDEGWDEYVVPVLDFVDQHIGMPGV